MKKIFLFLLTAVLAVGTMAETRKVAILETVDKGNELSYGIKLMVRSHLAEAVTNTPGYEAYDRTNLQQIFDEQEFQRTGYVSDEDIKKIGEMTGVQYVLVAEASKLDESNLFITAKILNVETARVEKTANIMTQTDIPSLQVKAQDLASRLLAEIKTPKELPTMIYPEGAYIERLNFTEYSIGGDVVDRHMYYQFIENNQVSCLPAYRQFNMGKKMTKIGGWMTGIGSPLMIGGTILLAIYGGDGDNADEIVAGGVLFGIGAASALPGIVLLSVGVNKKHTAYKKYNRYCAPKNKATARTINLQTSQNGLGLAYCF